MKTGEKAVRLKIKNGDQVIFIAGREYNRFDSTGARQPLRGKVIAVDPKNGKVKVEGAMLVKRHQKPVPQLNVQGGITEKESWVDVSNVALIDPKSGKPTRVKLEVRDGEKVRVAKSGAVIPSPVYVRKVRAAERTEETQE